MSTAYFKAEIYVETVAKSTLACVIIFVSIAQYYGIDNWQENVENTSTTKVLYSWVDFSQLSQFLKRDAKQMQKAT